MLLLRVTAVLPTAERQILLRPATSTAAAAAAATTCTFAVVVAAQQPPLLHELVVELQQLLKGWQLLVVHHGAQLVNGLLALVGDRFHE